MSDSEVIKILKEMPIFQNLSDEHLLLISKGFSINKVKEGKFIFYQSEESTDLYIILDGAVKACLLDPEGKELILNIFKKGDFFGELSLLDGKPRSATVIALKDSVVGILKREQFLTLLKNNPMIAISLLSALVERIRMTDEMLGAMAFLDVSRRILKYILNIAQKEGEKTEEGYIKINKITHRELASCTGASREAVTKALKILKFKGIIFEKNGHFFISPDIEI
ncbi:MULTISPECIES: Crp/Fnr family transcriptional regulator [Thermodesulfovibrio]|jgi:CRP/FNR family transcriptional regulator/CRP/FNR family cyclic AMP-dependent transcriptional regulator|uniref:cAMP receptor protein n=1 Tax=Thermodesulfovibrio yellowstonii (strain ATCC 51303 / DSM 11347 / YP87) TaxID=289376 RepID=B5YI76_THEYD|nr:MULTISPECIES: Crp/Fnr family transcriptional regulator [Thermodesulfovibrio]ACI21839.1 catabolite gene activator [Thermodesulfovibrio yellowstonii DSM 11347]MDI6865984.1 Crp/Fnr family transcriptional regulator [Thermodesulfovibrio yellowstonii]